MSVFTTDAVSAVLCCDGNGRNGAVYISIDSEPVSQARPRASNHGGQLRVYNPQSRLLRSFRDVLKAELETIGVQQFPVFARGRIAVKCEFRVGRRPHDLDRMVNFILDGLEGVMYHNDVEVFHLMARKEFVDCDSDKGATIEVLVVE